MALILDESFNNGIPTKSSQNDPYANSVVSYNRFFQSEGIVDSSQNPKTLSFAGNANISTAQSKFGTSSFSFDGSGDYLTVGSHTDLTLNTGDFTIEFWVRFTSTTGFQRIISSTNGAFSANTTVIRLNSSGVFYAISAAGVGISGTTTVSANTWYHVAFVRESNVCKLYVNGVAEGGSETSTASSSEPIQYIGGLYTVGPSEFVNGYIDEIRITKGIARYTSTFTPSTIEFNNSDPNFSNVSLLLHSTYGNLTNKFVDLIGQSWTPTNAVISTSQRKFGSSSGYFDGTAWISTPDSASYSFGTENFTIDTWVYISGNSTVDNEGNRSAAIYGVGHATTLDNTFWALEIMGDSTTTGTGVKFRTQLAGVDASVSAPVSISQNAWHHIAVSRTNTATYFCVDGIIYTAAAINQNVNMSVANAGISIGRFSGVTTQERYLVGYIAEARITNGVARYVPSNVALTGSGDPYYNDNTLLIHSNGTNGSTTFTDSSKYAATITPSGEINHSNLQTIVNSTSIKFDGNGDYLTLAQSGNWDFYRGFTIEFWVYVTAYDTSGTMFIHRAATGLEFYAQTTGAVLFGRSNSVNVINTSAGYITTGQWYHLAVSWDLTTYRLFKNGVLTHSVVDTNYPTIVNTAFRIGSYAHFNVNYDLNGYMDEIRVTNGTCRYITSFNPLKDPHPNSLPVLTNAYTDTLSSNVSGKIVLSTNAASHLHFTGANNSTTFTDESGKTWTRTGTPVISTIDSKFDGSSGYFTTSNYITTPNHNSFDLGTDPFTIECWVKATTTTTTTTTLICAGTQDTGASGGGWALYYTPIGNSFIVGFRKYLTTGTSIGLETQVTATITDWNHIAVTRDNSGFLSIFVDGKKLATGSMFNREALPVPNSGTIKIGGGGTVASPNLYPFNGYIDELRIIKGIATYENNFTVPTSAYSYSGITNYKYTLPYRPMEDVYTATFATVKVSSTATLTPTYNATFKAVDIVSATTNSNTLWDISSQQVIVKGEVEIDIETISELTSNQWYIGIWNIAAALAYAGTSISNGNSFTHTQYLWNLYYISGNTNFSGATSISTKAHGIETYDPTTIISANQRRTLSFAWDYSKATGNNIVCRINGNLVFFARGTVYPERPGVFVQYGTARLHGIRVWDEPRESLDILEYSSGLTDNYGVLKGATQAQENASGSTIYVNGLTNDYGIKSYVPIEIESLIGNDQALNSNAKGFLNDYGMMLPENTQIANASLLSTYSTLKENLGHRNQKYGANSYSIKGLVQIKGTVFVPVKRMVQLIDETEGSIVYTGFSNADGTYQFDNLDPTRRYTVYALDEYTRTYRAVISDNQIPVKLSSEPHYHVRISGVSATGSLINFGYYTDNEVYDSNTTKIISPVAGKEAMKLVLLGDELFDNSLTRNRVRSFNPGSSYIARGTSKSGSGSLYCAHHSTGINSGGYEIAHSSDQNITGNFTIEFWVNIVSAPAGGGSIIQKGDWGSGSYGSWLVYVNASGQMFLYVSGNGTAWNLVSAVAIATLVQAPLNQWNFVSITRSNTNVYFHVNGTYTGTTTYSGSPLSTTLPITILSGSNGTSSLNAYLDDLVFYNNYSKYPFASNYFIGNGHTIAKTYNEQLIDLNNNTRLLMSANTLGDNSGLNTSYTTVGNPTLYTSGKIKSSIYFDGNSSITFYDSNNNMDPGTGPFTFETWINVLNKSGESFAVAGTYTIDSNDNTRWKLKGTVVGGIYIQYEFVNTTRVLKFTELPKINEWHNIAVSKSGNIIRLFINGLLCGSYSDTQNYEVTDYFVVGDSSTTNIWSEKLKGQIEDLRYSLSGRYTASYSPEIAKLQQPTEATVVPLTGVSSTVQLGNESASVELYDNYNNNTVLLVSARDFPWTNRLAASESPTISVASSAGTNSTKANDGILLDNALTTYYIQTTDNGSGSNNNYGPTATFTSARAIKRVAISGYGASGTTSFNYSFEAFVGGSWQQVSLQAAKTSDSYAGVIRPSNYYFNEDGAVTSTQWRVLIKNYSSTTSNYYASEIRMYTDDLDTTSIQDLSRFGWKMTNNGVVKSTDQIKFGTHSLYFNGSSNLTLEQYPDNLDGSNGSGVFTLEMWVYITGTGNMSLVNAGANWYLNANMSTNRLNYPYYGSGGHNLTANTWHHIALVKQPTYIDAQLNGSLGSGPYGVGTMDAGQIVIGNGFTGYIDDLRITAGVARYDAYSTFTPPSRLPLPWYPGN